MKDADAWVDRIVNAGCLFIGESSLVVLVDYVAGPSHVLPTGGTARFGSPLNVLDFVKLISTVKTDKNDIKSLGGAAAVIARAEGLEAHARAVEKRLEDMKEGIMGTEGPDAQKASKGWSGLTWRVSPATPPRPRRRRSRARSRCRSEDIIKLDANENPYGCSPRVLRALAG